MRQQEELTLKQLREPTISLETSLDLTKVAVTVTPR